MPTAGVTVAVPTAGVEVAVAAGGVAVAVAATTVGVGVSVCALASREAPVRAIAIIAATITMSRRVVIVFAIHSSFQLEAY